MVTRTKKSGSGDAGADAKTNAQFANTVRESAQQIWLAGLGAFSKAQEEGGKVFDSLVKEGVTIQRKTQSAAEEKLSEATNRMASMANDFTSKATGQWDKLENIFEERVSRALKKLGVPAAREIDELTARIEALERAIAQQSDRGGRGATAAKRTAARKLATKRSTARKSA